MEYNQLSEIPTEGLLTRIADAAQLLHQLQPLEDRLLRRGKGKEKIIAAAAIYQAARDYGFAKKQENKIDTRYTEQNSLSGRIRLWAIGRLPKTLSQSLGLDDIPITIDETKQAAAATEARFQNFKTALDNNLGDSGLENLHDSELEERLDCLLDRLKGFINQSWYEMRRGIPGLADTELSGYTPKDIPNRLEYIKKNAKDDLMQLIGELKKRDPADVSIDAVQSCQKNLDKIGEKKPATALYQWHTRNTEATMAGSGLRFVGDFVPGAMVPRPTPQQQEPPLSLALLRALGIPPKEQPPAPVQTIETYDDTKNPPVIAVIGPDGVSQPYKPALKPTGTTPTPANVRPGHSSPGR
jgi:hypothetical protein